MAPIIEVSNETLKTLNPQVYTIRNDLVIKPRVEVVSEPYIEVPEIGLAVAKRLTHHSKTWYNQHDALKKEDSIMLPTSKFSRFLAYLIAHPENKEYQAILEEIVGFRNSWRAENLDDYFVKEGDKWYDLTQNKTHKEKLNPCLMEDKTPGISLESWLSNPTKQGLPQANVKGGDLYYWNPREGSVAGFDAVSVGACLGCGRYPSYRGSSLGVRAAKQLK